MKKPALFFLNIILLLDIYLGVKIFANYNFACVLLASWGATYILAHRLPSKVALMIPGCALTITYFLFFDPINIPWKANLIVISTFLQLQAWVSLYKCKDLHELNAFETKIIDCSFIGILMPMYLAISGYTLRYKSYENDKLSLLLYTLLALLFLEATRHRSRLINSSVKENKRGRIISFLALLLLMATSLLSAHLCTGYFYNFIPSTAKYLNRYNPQYKTNESARITQDHNLEIRQSDVGYSNQTKLTSSFSLKKDFSKIDLSLKVHEGKDFIKPERIYLRCNQYSTYKNKQWFAADGATQKKTSDQQGWIKIKEAASDTQLLYTVTRFNKNLVKLPVIGEVYKVKAPSAKITARVIEINSEEEINRPIKILSKPQETSPKKLQNVLLVNDYIPETKIEKQIAALARSITEKSPTIEDKIYELRNYLHSYCKYSLVVQNSYNMHPLKNFLFHERKGHCVLFASAYCLMLKSIGIHANLSSGYYGGDLQKDSHELLFYPGNAHTWVEIKLKNNEYLIIDPTPSVTNWPARGIHKLHQEKEYSLLNFINEVRKWWNRASLQEIYIYLAILSLIPFILLWKWKLWKSLIPKKNNEPKYLLKSLDKLSKIQPKLPAQSLREYYLELVNINPAVKNFEPIIEYSYKVKFHNQPRDAEQEKRFLKMLKEIKL